MAPRPIYDRRVIGLIALNLVRNRGRTALTATGIVVGEGAGVGLIGAGLGVLGGILISHLIVDLLLSCLS